MGVFIKKGWRGGNEREFQLSQVTLKYCSRHA